jgi:hypothetical protein
MCTKRKGGLFSSFLLVLVVTKDSPKIGVASVGA